MDEGPVEDSRLEGEDPHMQQGPSSFGPLNPRASAKPIDLHLPAELPVLADRLQRLTDSRAGTSGASLGRTG